MSPAGKEIRDLSQTQLGVSLGNLWSLLETLKAEKRTTLNQEKINALVHLLSLILVKYQSPQNAVHQVKQIYPKATYSLFFKSRVEKLFLSLSTIEESMSHYQKPQPLCNKNT